MKKQFFLNKKLKNHHNKIGDEMKKIMFIGLIIVFYLVFGNINEKNNLIPTDAIRIRVLANSDSKEDQEIKREVKSKLEIYLYDLLSDVKDISTADLLIEESIPNLKSIINTTYKGDYNINYGLNYFPKKEYKGITYEEGYYNSLVVSLGEGLGQNWWCILFPPLCMLEGQEIDDVEYRSLIGDILNKYLK